MSVSLSPTLKVNRTGKFGVIDAASLKINHTSSSSSAPAPATTAKKREVSRANKESGDRISSTGLIGGPFAITPNPSFLADRSAVFDRLWDQYQKFLSSKSDQPISITLPNGEVKEGVASKTTPLDIAKSISNGLAEAVVIAKVVYSTRYEEDNIIACDEDEDSEAKNDHGNASEGELWDLNRPLIGDCTMTLLKFEDTESKTVFWHSSAHILGAALEAIYGAYLTIGPPLQAGFYYDSYMGSHSVSEEDMKKIEAKADEICKKKYPFQRLVLSKEQALEMFSSNPFKVNLITNKVPDGAKTTVYKCGPLIDLCMGPHLPNTGKIKAFATIKTSGTNWLGQAIHNCFYNQFCLQRHQNL
jgi:threonyl-tRNA synthetase